MKSTSSVRFSKYVILKLLVPFFVVLLVIVGVYVVLGAATIRESAKRSVSSAKDMMESLIVSYLEALLPFENELEEKLETPLNWMKSLYDDFGLNFSDEFSTFLSANFSTENFKGFDWLVFKTNGDVICGDPVLSFRLDDFTRNVLSKLEVGDVVYEKIENVVNLSGEYVFEKNGFVRLSEELFGVVRLFFESPGMEKILAKIRDLKKRYEFIDFIGIYQYDLKPFGEIFDHLDTDLQKVVSNVIETGGSKLLEDFDKVIYISVLNIPSGSERRFSKPFVLVVKAHIPGLIKRVLILILGTVGGGLALFSVMAFIISKVAKKLNTYIDHLIGMMEKFKREKIFIPPEDVVESEITEFKKLFMHFFELSEDLTAHVEELEAAGEEIEKAYRELEKTYEDMERAHLKFAQKLAMIAEGYDETTGNHIVRVGELSAFIALKLGLGEEFVERIRVYAQLHDIGKILVPHEILNKPGKLTEEEFEIMKRHTIYGEIFLKDIEKFEMARNIALYHHEKYDGSGYPFGLKGESIPMEARIVAVVDVYDALRSKRPYKEAFSHEKSIEIILRGDGRTSPEHFDPRILEILERFSSEIKDLWDSIASMETELERELKEIVKRSLAG